MAFDGFFTKKIVNELNDKAINSRITKINNISNNKFILVIRKSFNMKLLISVEPNASRIHITESNYENPKSPSKFCTLLRKYISGAIISKFSQINNDRIIILHSTNNDELGYKKKYNIIVELMGKHSNIILTDENFKIIDAIKNNYSIEYKRATIKDINYELPPTRKKINPFDFSNYNKIKETSENNFFINNFYGVSKLLSNNINNLNDFKNFCLNIDTYNKPIFFIDNGKKDFYFYDFNKEYDKKVTFNSLSNLLDFYYLDNNLLNENKNTEKHKLFSFVKNKIKKLKNKINILNNEIKSAEKIKDLELKGNLLLANSYLYKNKKFKEIILDNFYSENVQKIKISLDENLTMQENATKYFEKNKKNKRTIKNLKIQLAKTNEEINFFENLSIQIENATISDLAEITEELVNLKYIKKKINKKNKTPKFTIVNYKNVNIYVGKNNVQNDTITNKLAKKNYLWFHAKNIPGSHVVIFSDKCNNEIINVASMLAAYFSKAKNDDFTYVDYTYIKNVKKISKATPGMVTYTNQKTLKVEIDKNFINKIIINLNK